MGGFSPQGAGGATADQIWSYATRTLTQAKFPFWSAIITQNQGYVSVASGATSTITIQPAAGETWLLFITGSLLSWYSGAYLQYADFNGSTVRVHISAFTYSTYTHGREVSLTKVLTSSLYGRLIAYNPDSVARDFYYGYSGFKLSQPFWSPNRLNVPPAQPWKKPTSLSLPSSIAPLQKYAAEILGLDPAKPNDYALGVILEEDTPLAIDEKTGFPVERLTAVVKADVLADFIAKFKARVADPVATGYARYIKKWLVEGIDLGVRV